MVAGAPHVLAQDAQEPQVEAAGQEDPRAEEPEAGSSSGKSSHENTHEGDQRRDDAHHRAEVARHASRCLAELDEGVHDQLDLLRVRPLAPAGGAGELLEPHGGLVEPGPGDEAEDVAVGLRHRIDDVENRA
jgi:hypothetical protein